MANFLEYLRQQNIFAPRPPYGNDLPQQGGITGRMPLPPGPNSVMDINFGADPSLSMPPPQFGMPGIEAPTVGLENDPYSGPYKNVQFGRGPLGVNDWDVQQASMPTPGQGMPEMDAGERMRQLYQPQTEATDRFNQMIAQYPQEDKPSWLRRIGAMIVDYTKGPQRGEQFFHEPYNEKVEEWKNKIGPAQQAANLERYENVNQRTLAANQIAAELREKAQEARDRRDVRLAENRENRARIYDFKTRNPGWKVLTPKGGNVQLVHPITGEIKDTGVETGTLTDLDKIWFQSDERINQIEATGEQARQTEQTRQTGRIEAIQERGEQARQTREVVPGGVAGRTSESASQTKVRQYNVAREIVNSSPALSRFIKLGQANEFTVIKPNERGGPTPQQYSDIINAIYKGASGVGGRGAMAGPGPGQPIRTPPPAPKGWKYVAKPGGGWTAVPDTGIQ